MIAGIMTLLTCAVIFRKCRLQYLRKLLMPSIFMNILGFLLAVWPFGGGLLLAVAPALGSICLGIGSAFMFLLWADALNCAPIEEVEAALPLSLVIVLLYAIAVPLLPYELHGILMLLAPLASGTMLYLSFNLAPQPATSSDALATPRKQFVYEIVRLSIPLLVFYIALCWNGVAAQFLMANGRSIPDIIGSLVGIFFIFAFVSFSFRIDFEGLFRWLCPLAVAALVLNFWKSSFTVIAIGSISSVLDVSLWIVTYLYCSRKARTDYVASLIRTALLLAAAHTGAIIGNVLATYVMSVVPHANEEAFSSITLVLIVAMVAATMVVVGRREAKRGSDRESASSLGVGVADRCKEVAERCHLTARELDVLMLLASGRSQPYICECLTLSKSTISTHVSHIYQKCGVHSRQELLDILAP